MDDFNEIPEIDLSNCNEHDEPITFTALDEDGNTVEYQMIFLYKWDKNGRNYIVYTDNTVDEDGCTNVYATVYTEDESGMNLEPIETEEEWALIDALIEEYDEVESE